MTPFSRFLLFFLIITSVSACVKENSPYIRPAEVNQDENISITFWHFAYGEILRLDTMIYETSVGNQYMVTDLQYFISCIRVHQAGGKWMDVNLDHEVHYVDLRLVDTWTWVLEKNFRNITIDSISFVFGLDSENNYSYRFPDPPERDMFWPEILGGGYHYMKLNMKWKNAEMTEVQPFMFHLGIGQVYKGNVVNVDSIIGYVPNYFTVRLPLLPMMKSSESETSWIIAMNIEKWFDGTYAFDFAGYPKGIMQNQEGMYQATRNGLNAFEFHIAMDD